MTVRGIGWALTAASLLCISCAALPPPHGPLLDFFVPAPASDPWRHKIANWQERHELDPTREEASPSGTSALAHEYADFWREQRRRLASETVSWVQELSRRHYRPDGDRDHWATLGEVIAQGQDDCDGLDLLTFQLLRGFGFDRDEIFRAIVVEAQTGQHHMVTLWFEQSSRNDPFVLDPTGVVTGRMVRLSQVAGWQPIQLFDETAHYRVETATRIRQVAGK